VKVDFTEFFATSTKLVFIRTEMSGDPKITWDQVCLVQQALSVFLQKCELFFSTVQPTFAMNICQNWCIRICSNAKNCC